MVLCSLTPALFGTWKCPCVATVYSFPWKRRAREGGVWEAIYKHTRPRQQDSLDWNHVRPKDLSEHRSPLGVLHCAFRACYVGALSWFDSGNSNSCCPCLSEGITGGWIFCLSAHRRKVSDRIPSDCCGCEIWPCCSSSLEERAKDLPFAQLSQLQPVHHRDLSFPPRQPLLDPSLAPLYLFHFIVPNVILSFATCRH